MKNLPVLVLQGCTCVDRSLCSLCAQTIWGRAGADVGRVTPSSGHADSLVGEEREVTPEPSVSRGFCAHWVSPPYGAVWVPRCWSKTLLSGPKLIPSLISVHCPVQMCVCMFLCVLLCVCVYSCVCVPVCVCVHYWVLKQQVKIHSW